MPRVFIGYDSRETLAYEVCRRSLLRHCPDAYVTPLRQDNLRRAGLYRRAFWSDDGQRYDSQDGRPFSTEVSFSRFLVPMLGVAEDADWVLFCDSDFLFRESVSDLFDLAEDRYAVQVVKHDYKTKAARKYLGNKNENYPRKNWSSLILWNCAHPANRQLTPELVQGSTGAFLHRFSWLPDELIGELPLEWNWLESEYAAKPEAPLIHYTLGTPCFAEYAATDTAHLWWDSCGRVMQGLDTPALPKVVGL